MKRCLAKRYGGPLVEQNRDRDAMTAIQGATVAADPPVERRVLWVQPVAPAEAADGPV